MRKSILRGAAAAVALVSMSSTAHAQTSQTHYAAVVPVGPGVPVTLTNPSGFLGGLAQLAFELAIANLNIGTRYTAQASAPGNTQAVTPVVNVAFSLSGTVQKDCSFYAGNNANATNIDFGVIGVRTGNNENVNSAFDMVGPATAEIETLTAGCNFNNTVSITKTNNINGLVNSAAGGYDSNQFQANLPYSVDASWTGTTSQAGPQAGTPQNLNVATNEASDFLNQGAWRSAMNIDINVPVASLGLVAGNYTDTMTLTLTAL